MLRRFFLWLMPVYLTLIELAVKTALAKFPGIAEEASFLRTGPSLAVAGISLLLPVMIPKPFSVVLPSGTAAAIVLNEKDKRVIDLATILVFLTLGLWIFDLYLTHQAEPGFSGVGLGFAVFLIGAGMTEWKETVK